MIRSALATVARIHAWRQPLLHPKFGAFDRAALFAAADLFALTNHPTSNGALIGALQAKKCGYEHVRMVEFGVAAGDGLLRLCAIADILAHHLDLEIEIVGFDNAAGLPPPADYRDHPEIWSARQYRMADPEELRAKLPSGCELVIGDISQTIATLEGNEPIAFATVDVDFYSSTLAILDWFGRTQASNLLPATPIYFDDVFLNWTYGPSSGEELAIAQFNANQNIRYLELKDSARQLFALKANDHPISMGLHQPREPLELPPRRYTITPNWLVHGPPS